MGDYTEHDVAALAAVLGAAAADGIRHGSFTLARRILDTFQWPSAGDEPRFVIRGKDKFAPATVLFHRGKCVEHGLAEQAAQERLAVDEIVAWQVRNPDLVQYPDHTHVPAGSPVDDGGPPATGVGHPTQDVDRPGPGPVDNPGPSVGEVGHPGGQL